MEQAQAQTCAQGERSAEFFNPLPQGGVAGLMYFPEKLRDIIVKAVLKTKPARCTDIWYEDTATASVVVMRSGMHWQLNETAGKIWLSIGEQVESIVNNLCKEYGEENREEVVMPVVEFLLHAHSYGLIDLYPEAVKEEAK